MDTPSDNVILNEELCTVGSDHAAVTWATTGPCSRATLYLGEDPAHLTGVTAASSGKYHWGELTGLRPATPYWYQVESAGARGSLNCFETLPFPRGRFLFSFGIITDAHVPTGTAHRDPNRMFLGKLSEHADVLLAQSILDAKARNVDLVVFMGDFTDTGAASQYVEVGTKILPLLGNTPYLLCPGNHDKFTRFGGVGERGFYDYLTDREHGYQSTLFLDHQFILLDSCRENDNKGYLDTGQLAWLEDTLRETGDRPAFIFLHHPGNGLDLWLGLRNHRDFAGLVNRFPCVRGVFSGHMHRNKVTTDRSDAGDVPYVEVAATVQYPCGYAVVRVYERGFVYNSYKVSRLDLSEMSRERFILKSGGEALLTWYSFGGLADRCLSCFSGHVHRPGLYELSTVLDHRRALELYGRAQPQDGASLAPVRAGWTRVVLGRFPSAESAGPARQQKQSLYRISTQVRNDSVRRPMETLRFF